MPPAALPISEHLPAILARLEEAGAVVVEAPPGAGKTTRVPPAILDAAFLGAQDVAVLQPRRLAVRLAAQHVARERRVALGDEVGYTIRFDDQTGPCTRLRFLTEGIFTRRLLTDPTLADVGCVVLDEFHERHLTTDVALAAVQRLRKTDRPDLRLVVMSATLDGERIAAWLDDAPRVRAEGRVHPVEIEHLEAPDDRPLEEQVAGAVKRLLARGIEGDVLVFLPGVGEIHRSMEACRALARRANLVVLPLHGDLPPERQDEAVRPAPRRKLVLATNVAETSVTIDGIAAVIDCGLARIPAHDPWSGLPRLEVRKIARAAAAQRAGRAGRTQPGVCLRLYTRVDHETRPAFETPEIARADLAATVLELRALGTGPASFPFFEPPERQAVEAAETLLRRLDALDDEGRLTGTGRRMLAFPLHPRLARLVVHAERCGAPRIGARAAAVLSGRPLTLRSAMPDVVSGASDVVAQLDALAEGRRLRGDGYRLRAHGIDPGAFRTAERVARMIEGLARATPSPRLGEREAERVLATALLLAFPDRVARRRAKGKAEVLLSSGGAATLAVESVVRDAEFLVAVEAQARPRGTPLVRLASEIDAEALVEHFPRRIREARRATWLEQGERVEIAHQLLYDDLVLEERRMPAAGEPEAEALLRERALAAGVGAFEDPEAVDRLLARLAVVADAFPEKGLPDLGAADVRAALADLCRGCASFAQIREAGVLRALVRTLLPEQQRLLAEMAPERVSLGGRRTPRVEYARGRPPWIASFIQDFFGSKEGPRICAGRVPVVLHLLAPSRRPVQVTTDLAGFWERHYPSVRREMSRRYPKHGWPEDPLRP